MSTTITRFTLSPSETDEARARYRNDVLRGDLPKVATGRSRAVKVDVVSYCGASYPR